MISARRTLDVVRWYLREVAGENAYERYVEHGSLEHPGRPVLSRREFERQRQDDRDGTPQVRCC
ncbi:MAG: hypothetical protein QOF11_831 [Chloroflexota bacterium]|jgi:uncharacterized short protein YbdD (DUF466 family)|nr:hypothetical protein [Chloroflexota bacterium]